MVINSKYMNNLITDIKSLQVETIKNLQSSKARIHCKSL